MTERYSPRPWHLLLSVLLIALASATIALEGWFWFGLATLMFGWLSGLWIVLAGYWESYGAYWEKLSRFGELMKDNRNPQLWAAMGFVPPPESFRLEVKTGPEIGKGYGATQIFDLPCSPQAFSTLCDGVMMGQPLSETYWVNNKTFTSPVFRKLKKELEKRILIRLKSAGKPTQGYVLTRKGRELFLAHCSTGVRKLLEDQINLVDTRNTPQLPSQGLT